MTIKCEVKLKTPKGPPLMALNLQCTDGVFLTLVLFVIVLALFIVVFFANKTPLGEPDGQVAATICLPCPALSPLYLSSVFTPRYCFPCIYNVHFKILSPLYLSSVYCILFQNVVPLYLSSMYVHSKLHNIHCQLRSIDLIQSFKISSNKRRERSLPAGPTFSPPTNKELWRPWWRVRELISVFVFISYLSPFLEEFCASGVFVEIFSWYNLALHIEEERNSNHLPCRSDILIVISQTYVLWFFQIVYIHPPTPSFSIASRRKIRFPCLCFFL